MRRLFGLFLALAITGSVWASPNTTTILWDVYLSSGVVATSGTVTATLSQAGSAPDGSTNVSVAARQVVQIGSDGHVSLTVVPNDTITPTGTYYILKYEVRTPVAASWTENRVVVTTPDPANIGDAALVNPPPGVAYPYSTVQDEGVNLPRRVKLNFTGAGVNCVDGVSSTDCSVTATGGGGSPGGSSQDVQVNASSAFGSAPGFTADTATGEVGTKILNKVRMANKYADSGNGASAATCWTGWEDVFDSFPQRVHAPAGYYCWSTPKTISAVSANDREPKFELSGDGRGATVFLVSTPGALTIDGSLTTAAYGMTLRDFSVGLSADTWYGNGVFKLTRGQHFDVSNINFYGGTLFGSTLVYNTYAGYLINLDTTYNGALRNVSSYGRYVYIFEKDDASIASEDDTIHFDTLFTKGPLMGLVRAHAAGVHNLLFTNLKYQTNIEIAADTNQYDVTTASGTQNAGITSYVVASSSAFQTGDPVLLDVGDLLEVNRVASVPDGTHITLAHATRFAHATGTQVLHGGVGIGLSGTSRMVSFKNAMFEQCASGVMLDATYALHMDDVVSTCTEVVQVVGPSSTGGTTGLWHGIFNNLELSRVPAADTMYGVRVRSNADSANVRQLEFDHIERNTSSDDTLVEFQNDAGTNRNYSLCKSFGGNRVCENRISSALASSNDVDAIYYGGTKIHNWTGSGNYTATGKITAGTFIGFPSGTTFPASPAAGDMFVITDDTTSGDCNAASTGSARTLCRYNGSGWQAVGDGGTGGGGYNTIKDETSALAQQTTVAFTGAGVTCVDAGAQTTCDIPAAPGGGDNVRVNSVAVVDPDYVSTGDIGFVNSSNTVTANINSGVIVDGDISGSAAISDSKLAQITTGNKVANSATTATSTNTVSTIVARDSSGNFNAGTITASLSGNATTATTVTDAELAAIQVLTSQADRVPYYTGLGTASLATFTSAGRALVDDADATAQRATLGLGSLALLSAVGSAEITNASVALVDMADMATASVIYRKTGGTGPPEVNTITTLKTDLNVPNLPNDTAYSASTWDANTDAPTKNAVRDKFESLGVGGTVTHTLGPLTQNSVVLGNSSVSGNDTYVIAGLTSDASGNLTAASLTAASVIDNTRGLELVDNSATCQNPASGASAICTTTLTGSPRVYRRDTGLAPSMLLEATDIDTSAELATILGDETGTAGGFVRATSPTIDSPTFTTKFNAPRVTAFPGSPATGDVVVVTDDGSVGACNSSGGTARTLCYYNGTSWVSLGDGGSSSGGDIANNSFWTAAGDLAVGTSPGFATNLARGTNGQVLKAGASTVAWADAIKVLETSVAADDVIIYKDTTDGYVNKALPTTGTNGCAGATDKLQYNRTTHAWVCGTDQSAATAWSAIADPGAGSDIAMAQTAQTMTWDTPATAGAVDDLTIIHNHDATTDASTQRALVVTRGATSGAATLETLVQINNNDTDGSVTNGIELTSAAGAMTTAVNATDSDIVTALAIGSNDITTTSTTISSTELDVLDGGVSKSEVGLGNVDNTSDATKDAATTTLTNKTIDGGDSGTGTTRASGSNIVRARTVNGDTGNECNTLTDGKQGEMCVEEDDGQIWVCVPSAGDCDTGAEWKRVDTGGGTVTGIQGDSGGATTGATIVLDGTAGVVTSRASDTVSVSLDFTENFTTDTMLIRESRFTSDSSTCTGGGILGEGVAANSSEWALCFPAAGPTGGADRRITMQSFAGDQTLANLDAAQVFAATMTFNGATNSAIFNTAAADFNAGATFDTVAPIFNAGATFAGSTVLSYATGTTSSATATKVTAAPNSSFVGTGIPSAWAPNTAYSSAVSVSNDSGKQYYRSSGSCTSAGSGGPTGTGTCSVTTSTVCTSANGTDTHNECPGSETCTNAKTDNTCTWRYIGKVSAGTATGNAYWWQPVDTGDDYDAINGDDGEFQYQIGYNYKGNARIDTSEYALFQQFTWGFTDVNERQGEWFITHETVGGTNWHPWAMNFNDLNGEGPTADITFKWDPNNIGFQMSAGQAAFGSGHTGHGQLEVLGNGVLYVGGSASQGYISFEGSSNNGFQTFLSVVNPTAARAINLPNADGTVLLDSSAIATSQLTTEVRSMNWQAGAFSTDGTQCAAPTEVTINGGPKMYTVICADNDASTIYGSTKMPDSWDGGTPVTFALTYIQTAANTSAMNSDIAAQCRGNGEVPSSTWGTEVAMDDAAVVGSNSNDITVSAAVTPAGTCAAGDMLYWRWQLDAAGTTTAVATLHFTNMLMEYTSNVGD